MSQRLRHHRCAIVSRDMAALFSGAIFSSCAIIYLVRVRYGSCAIAFLFFIVACLCDITSQVQGPQIT